MTGGQGVAAGWYDDRATAGVVRWFDGTAWTEHTRPAEHTRPTEPAAFVVPGGGAVSPPMTAPPVTMASVGSAAYSPVPTHAPGQAAPFGGQVATFGGQVATSGHPAFGGQATAGAFGGPAATGAFGGQAAPPSRFDSYGQQPAFGQPQPAFGPAGMGGMGGAPSYAGSMVDHAGIASARRRVHRDLWLGIGLLLLGAIIATWVAASISAAGGYGGGRHYVSTAGVIGGLASFYRARKS